MEEDEIYEAESDASITLDDVPTYSDEDPGLSSLVRHVLDKFSKSEDTRRQDEERWLRAYRNYRGLYGPDVQFTETEKSRGFVKVTKTKTLAAFGQIIDVLFANNKFPISVEPTTLPEGVEDTVHFDPKSPPNSKKKEPPKDIYGFSGDGREIPPGATRNSLLQQSGPLEDKLSGVEGLTAGPGVTPSSVTFHPSMVAAKKMEKKIMDQLEEANASKQLRSTAFEMPLFGTGIMKGPFVTDKEYPNCVCLEFLS